MIENTVEAGKQLVVEILRDLAASAGIQPSNIKWEWGPVDFDLPPGPGIKPASPDFHPLAVLVGNRRKVVKFSEALLIDLAGSSSKCARNNVQQLLDNLLKKVGDATGRIGF